MEEAIPFPVAVFGDAGLAVDGLVTRLVAPASRAPIALVSDADDFLALLLEGPTASGKSSLLRSACAATRQRAVEVGGDVPRRGKVVSVEVSPESLSAAAPGDLPHAIHRLFGRVELLLRGSDGHAGEAPSLEPPLTLSPPPPPPAVLLVVDDIDRLFPAADLRERQRTAASAAHSAGGGADDDVTFADAVRAWVRHVRRLAGAPALRRRFAVAATASTSAGVAPPVLACFGAGGVRALGVLSPPQRSLALVEAARHFGLVDGDDSSDMLPNVSLAPEADVAALADEHCSGFVLGDVVRVAKDAAVYARLAPQLAQRKPPQRLSALATLSAVVAGHVPIAMLAADTAAFTVGAGSVRDAVAGAPPASLGALGRWAPPSGLPGLVDAADYYCAPGGAAAPAALASDASASFDSGGGKDARAGFYGWAGGAGLGDGDDDGDGDAEARQGGAFGAPGSSGGAVPPSLAALLRPTRPAVAWEDVGGQEAAKRALHDLLLWPLAHPAAVRALGLQLPAGILLYGPPGTGKTLLAKAVATRLGARFVSVSIPAVLRPGVGDSERALAAAFGLAAASAPCVVFLDEVQALIPPRHTGGGGSGDDAGDRMASLLTSTLLACMDGLRPSRVPASGDDTAAADAPPPRVLVLAATNVPEALDPALLRPGRFDRCVLVSLPDEPERAAMLRRSLARMPLDLCGNDNDDGGGDAAGGGLARAARAVVDFAPVPPAGAAAATPTAAPPQSPLDALAAALARATAGFSGADLANVCRRAATAVVREHVAATSVVGARSDSGGAAPRLAVTPRHLWAAVDGMTPSCPPARVAELTRWRPPSGW